MITRKTLDIESILIRICLLMLFIILIIVSLFGCDSAPWPETCADKGGELVLTAWTQYAPVYQCVIEDESDEEE